MGKRAELFQNIYILALEALDNVSLTGFKWSSGKQMCAVSHEVSHYIVFGTNRLSGIDCELLLGQASRNPVCTRRSFFLVASALAAMYSRRAGGHSVAIIGLPIGPHHRRPGVTLQPFCGLVPLSCHGVPPPAEPEGEEFRTGMAVLAGWTLLHVVSHTEAILLLYQPYHFTAFVTE